MPDRKTILITGGAGMLGHDASRAFEDSYTVVTTDRCAGNVPMDITDPASVQNVLDEKRPDLVLNCAAYTDVEGATREPDAAFRVNAWGAWTVAAACAERDIPLCHISTDFVFDGEKGEPYTEFDTPNPINAYGASKLAGEQAIQRLSRRFWIVRTQWLYGVHGRNFAFTVLRLARERGHIDVVDDQIGAPTHTVDLARTLRTIVEECPCGLYHANNAGECSWFEFARAVLEGAGEDPAKVRPISAAAYHSPTRRPACSTLRRYSLELQGRDAARPWPDALADFLAAAREAGKLETGKPEKGSSV